MKLPRPEILGVSTAAATALISLTWFGYFAQRPEKLKPMAGQTSSILTAYQKPTYGAGLPMIQPWPPPPVQSRSGEWVYDLFTPPEIFYDATLGKFTVTSPVTLLIEDQPGAPEGEQFTGLQVVDVKQVPFRLQLIGYVKTDHGYTGLFENRNTGGVLLASKGGILLELGLVIEDIDVRREEMSVSGKMAETQLLAVASIRDVGTGELVVLTTAARCFARQARATLVAFGPSPTQREVGEGDVWEIGGVAYEIDKIQLSPVAVVIKRQDGGKSDVERFTLSSSGILPPELPVPSL